MTHSENPGRDDAHTPDAARISVVIPHLNQPEFLKRCLLSLQAGSRVPEEIIVVDNGSVALPRDICDAFDGVQLLHQPEPGPGPARNLGTARATGDILAFIDADCLADPEWLAVAEREMADPDAQILGGDVRIAYDDPDRLTMLEAYESIFAYRMDRYIAREGFTGTGNLVVRRAVLDAVGPFAGLSVAEDRDWGQRATRAGYVIRYVPGLKVFHPARKSFAELRQKWDRQMAHDFSGVRGNVRKGFVWTLKTLAMIVSPLFELPRIATSDRIAGLRSKGLALAMLFRIRLYRFRCMVLLLAGADPDRLSGSWNRPGPG
ncbi:glycosyltransferase [Puniceibacterium sediminis]|uniref:Glycosyl transferase family 2 n=1 Tax=Puniceibacterium sediminis TaxID=1608407 RepID=A0A238YLF4_9RHOB|nr:glycosyltransferase [Puniceibacterium sediminis]SNR72086.1 Glycosyl transferase family 2 [Puniceibacterium sediminis]